MSLKVKDFASSQREENVSGRSINKQEEINLSDDDFYDPPPRRSNGERHNSRSSSRRSESRRRSYSRSPSRNPRFQDVPSFRDEKPFFGPKDHDKNIQVCYPSTIEGFANDNDAFAQMESMGLPTGFSLRQPDPVAPKQKKGDKKTFYCKICLIELNSLDTMTSHVKGVKHMKKELQLKEEKNQRYMNGEISKRELEEEVHNVVPIANPPATKQKVPIRLHDKIKETRDPVVGLDFVKEYIAVSDPEMEPHYECDLCGNQGIANGMFSHLMGQKHRYLECVKCFECNILFEKQRFVEHLHRDNPHAYLDLSQGELLKLAKQHAENQENLNVIIKTRRSDEEYPWPPGKAPWSIENGGTGIPPDGARENYSKNSFKDTLRDDGIKIENGQRERRQSESESRRNERRSEGGLSSTNRGSGSSGGGGLPSPDSLRKPKSDSEAEQMVSLGERMISLGLEGISSLSSPEREALEAVFTTIVVKMKAKRGMSSTSNGDSQPSGGGKRSQPRNSRSPSPPVKRERRSSRSPSRRNDRDYNRPEDRNGRGSGYGNGSRDNRNGSRDDRNGYENGGFSRREGSSRGGGSDGRRGRNDY